MNPLFLLVHSKQSHWLLGSMATMKSHITVTKYVIKITFLIIIKNCGSIFKIKISSFCGKRKHIFINQRHLTENRITFCSSFIEMSQVQILKLSSLNCLHIYPKIDLQCIYSALLRRGGGSKEERWLNGSAPDCKSVVLGSNPAHPQHTANSVSPEVGSRLG